MNSQKQSEDSFSFFQNGIYPSKFNKNPFEKQESIIKSLKKSPDS